MFDLFGGRTWALLAVLVGYHLDLSHRNPCLAGGVSWNNTAKQTYVCETNPPVQLLYGGALTIHPRTRYLSLVHVCTY